MSVTPTQRKSVQQGEAPPEESGWAATILPAGTDKSFIAFRLKEENVSTHFCSYLPVSTFARRRRRTCGSAPEFPLEVFQFVTYAKLMQMSEKEIAELFPDHIVLDKFHRCGADM